MTNLEMMQRAKTEDDFRNRLFEFLTDYVYETKSELEDYAVEKWLNKKNDSIRTILRALFNMHLISAEDSAK